MENKQLTPIETVHNGVRYRSRLEARWAIFFDELGAKFFFEHEGFELPSGRYVPDFWFPELETFVEIKAKGMDTEYDERRRAELASASGCRVIVLVGEPGYDLDEARNRGEINCRFPDPVPTEEESAELERQYYEQNARWAAMGVSRFFYSGSEPPEYKPYPPHHKADGPYMPCLCPACGRMGFEFDGRGNRVCKKCPTRAIAVPDAENVSHEDKGYTGECARIVSAAKKANSARFWEAR